MAFPNDPLPAQISAQDFWQRYVAEALRKIAIQTAVVPPTPDVGPAGTQIDPQWVAVQQQTAFGEVLTAQLTPFVQSTAAYNRLAANMRSYVSGTGAATLSGGEFVCTTGATANSYAAIRSVRALNYKGGMGGRFRGTGRFQTGGVADSLQGVGFFNVGDALLFGFYGTEFGIIYQHGGLQEVRSLTLSAAATGASVATITLNGEVFSVPLTSGTVQHNAFEIERWFFLNNTTWGVTQNGATVQFASRSDGEKAGAYTFSATGIAVGTFSRTTAGVTKTTSFTPRTAWNVNTCDWIDTTKGNVFQIDFQYLGYGNIFFYVEDPETGNFVLVHKLKYANANVKPSLGNPSLHCGIFAASLGSTTPLTITSACVAAFLEGTPAKTRNPRSFANNKSVGTTLTNLFTVRNRDVFGGKANQVELTPLLLNVFTESARGANIQLITGATLGGDTNYSYVNESNLVAEIDTTATTVTGGTSIVSLQIAGNSSSQIQLADFLIRIPPEVTITVAAAVNSGAASATGAGLTWYEDL